MRKDRLQLGCCLSPTELLPSLGGAFPERHQQIGMWQTAEGAGGDDTSRPKEVYDVMAPSGALSACRAIRAKEMK